MTRGVRHGHTVLNVVVSLVPARIGSILAPCVGGALIAALALLVAFGCAGDDDVKPTGRIVAFVEQDVFLIPATGGKRERLRIGDYEFWEAAFSEDASKVAFTPRYGIDSPGITLMTLSDGSTTLVPNQPAQDDNLSGDIAWAPDGKSLAFVNADRVFTISTDGTELRELGGGVFPVWTPDSEHIVFVAGDYGGGPDQDIVVTRADGTDRRMLARGLYPDVSPSGEEVAYSTAIGVFVMPLSGGDPRLVVPRGFGPVWSPDGKFLAFTRYTECGHAVCSGRLFIVRASGGEPRAIGPTTGDPVEPQDWIR